MGLEVDIEKRFEKFHLRVRLHTEAGITGLLGASGCGKSMTLKCIAGIVTPDAGRIVLDGRVLFDSSARINLPPQKRRVGYLFQNYALFPHMTVAGNIAAGVPDKRQRSGRVAELLRAFRLEGMEGKYPRQLSGGQQQRVALARILASGPEALLLDEPFSALDSYLKWDVELELSDLLAVFPGAVLFVTHSRDEVRRLCRDVCVLDHGASQPLQSVEDLFERPATLSACLLSGCKNISRARALPGGLVEALDWGVTLDAGREVGGDTAYLGVRAHFLHPQAQPGDNRIPCTVERTVENVFSTVVMLSTPGGNEGYARLRLELPRAQWKNPPALELGIAPHDIMLLK